MNDARTIAAASAILRRHLVTGIPEQDAALAHVHVTTMPIDEVNVNVGRAALNVFLYRVEVDALHRAHPSAPAPLVLNLHYMLTAFGRVDAEDGDLGHRVLGAAMRVLHDHPVLLPHQAGEHTGLPGGLPMLAGMQVTPEPLNIEDLSRLWSMFRTSYRISTSYRVSVTCSTREVADPEHGQGVRVVTFPPS